MRYAMIMAGGAGTRLWPMSREGRPKQLLRFIGHGDNARCLLELARERLAGFVPPERAFICTSESYRAAIRAAIPALDDNQILGEPEGRDTLNAVGLAAAVFQKMDSDAVFAVLTADHIIEPVTKFQELLDLGFRMVEADPSRLVTFSIKPTHAATQFGYVERGTPIIDVPGSKDLAFRVARFVEKPDLPRAQAYVQSGVFGWNSGMFVWKAATVLECIRQYKPESYEGLLRIQDAWGTPRQREVLGAVYPTLPKISVDYAVMEPASKAKGDSRRVTVCTVAMDLKWLDVGSWPSYGQTLPADAAGNRVVGDATVVRGAGNLVVSERAGHTIALLGCRDMIVVHTPDATLIMPRDSAQDLKELHAAVDSSLR
ncbi:MAG: mannose-1-phosphate guanylyltransferase [Phycisphaerales bacterium]|nr:mannose-1-phosphate guanylyltransferase [Phycisphaerales bacterium]